MSAPLISQYHDLDRSARYVRDGDHRGLVGGLWEEIGKLQFEFLIRQGLTPGARVLDVGCGCFRAGVHLVEYLDPGHYYGIDISAELMEAGYERELGPLGLQHKLPRANLLCNRDFQVTEFGVTFDFALAQSLFTHLPLNHVRLCLQRLADVVDEGGVFYATVFLCPPDHQWSQPLHHERGGVTTHPADDPYHYRVSDLACCASELPWQLEVIGDWGHPRDQTMIRFLRSR